MNYLSLVVDVMLSQRLEPPLNRTKTSGTLPMIYHCRQLLLLPLVVVRRHLGFCSRLFPQFRDLLVAIFETR